MTDGVAAGMRTRRADNLQEDKQWAEMGGGCALNVGRYHAQGRVYQTDPKCKSQS